MVSSEVNPGARSRPAGATGGRLVVADGHHPEGGLGSAVMEALLGSGQQPLRVAHLAVRKMPGSGNGAELTAAAGIDAAHMRRQSASCSGTRDDLAGTASAPSRQRGQAPIPAPDY